MSEYIVWMGFRELCRQNKIRLRDLSFYLGAAPQTIRRWDDGENLPPLKIIPTMSELFGIPIDVLVLMLLKHKRYIDSFNETTNGNNPKEYNKGEKQRVSDVSPVHDLSGHPRAKADVGSAVIV